MDRANPVRMTLRWLVLASVLIQATTPDLLDLSLLSQSLPPGPILVVSGLPLRPAVPRSAEPGSSPMDDGLRSAVRGDDRSSDDLCAPIWPEVGVMRKRGTGAERCPGSCLSGDPLWRSCAAVPSGRPVHPSKLALPSDVRCRLMC